MRRLRKTVIVLTLLFAVASFSVSARRTLEAVDTSGAPLDLAYIAYSYMGSRFNPAHSTTYWAKPLALARSDSSGRIVLPATFHIHLPFPLESHPRLFVEVVYVPRMHNARARIDGSGRAVAEDFSSRPEAWVESLRNVSSIIERLMSWTDREPPLRERDPRSAALCRELIAAFRDEYDAFLIRYRDVARTRPEMPAYARASGPEEQGRWTASIDADLAREPTWGAVVTRLFGDELVVFRRWEAELR